MKTLIVLVASFCLASTAFSQSALEKAEAYYKAGLAAEKVGDPSKASTAYKAALQLNPNHANARYRAGQMKIQGGAIKASAREKKIGAVIIPAYQIEDTPVSEAIQLLSIAIDKSSEGTIAPNFVIEDPQGRLKSATVSMQLKNIPVKAILDYIHNQAGTKARYDEHAVVIIPR
ncbi:MAG: tetratricopeptide repeat protein [Luteolibacter sp.]